MPILTTRFDRVVLQDGRGNTRPLPPQDALARRGPIVQATLTPLDEQQQALIERGETTPPAVAGIALIDTGATSTCVDEAAARKAGLAVVDRGVISSASHPVHEVPIFAGNIQIPAFAIRVPRAMGVTLDNQGLVALLGRDALRSTLFIYNGVDGAISLSL